jgi:hypothetical protein
MIIRFPSLHAFGVTNAKIQIRDCELGVGRIPHFPATLTRQP